MSKNEQKVTKLWSLQNSSPVFLVQTIRNELFRCKTNLKKLVKSKRKIHKKTCLEKMEQCTSTDQKSYWKLVRRKLNQNEIKNTQYVSPKSLLNHFKTILNPKRTLNIPPDSSKIG